MDYIVGFLFGYYWYRFVSYLRSWNDQEIIKETEKWKYE